MKKKQKKKSSYRRHPLVQILPVHPPTSEISVQVGKTTIIHLCRIDRYWNVHIFLWRLEYTVRMSTNQGVHVRRKWYLGFPHMRSLVTGSREHVVLCWVEAQWVDWTVVSDVLQQARPVLSPPNPRRVIYKRKQERLGLTESFKSNFDQH